MMQMMMMMMIMGLIDIMHPATLRGVGVITKLYFAIFANINLDPMLHRFRDTAA